MYLINGELKNNLPFRIWKDGKTITNLARLSTEQLEKLNIYPATVVKPELEWYQKYTEPVITIEDGTAIVTYPVVDISQEERQAVIESAKEVKKSEIASARYEAEVSGIEVSGTTIKTDRESQAMITGAALQALADAEYSCQWKTGQGFIELTAEQIQGVAVAVRMHVQACFDREAELIELIEMVVTPEDLEAIQWEGVENE